GTGSVGVRPIQRYRTGVPRYRTGTPFTAPTRVRQERALLRSVRLVVKTSTSWPRATSPSAIRLITSTGPPNVCAGQYTGIERRTRKRGAIVTEPVGDGASATGYRARARRVTGTVFAGPPETPTRSV